MDLQNIGGGNVSDIIKPTRPKSVNQAEFFILQFLINGESGSMKNLGELGEKIGAGLDENDIPVDKTAHDRFVKASKNVVEYLERRLQSKRRSIE